MCCFHRIVASNQEYIETTKHWTNLLLLKSTQKINDWFASLSSMFATYRRLSSFTSNQNSTHSFFACFFLCVPAQKFSRFRNSLKPCSYVLGSGIERIFILHLVTVKIYSQWQNVCVCAFFYMHILWIPLSDYKTLQDANNVQEPFYKRNENERGKKCVWWAFDLWH